MEYGGYRLNHGADSCWKGHTNKRLVTQARTAWFFSALSRTRYGSGVHLDAARHGLDFLRTRMWDHEFGGFYWEVDKTGNSVTLPRKHLYAQAFGLYALSEFGIATQDSAVLALARQSFELLQQHAHDSTYGGYGELFHRDWTPCTERTQEYLGKSGTLKLMNTHLHILEALTTYYTATKDARARECILELVLVLSNAMVRKTIGVCTDEHHRDWSPVASSNRVSYGHDLEVIWLVSHACKIARLNAAPLSDLFRTLFHYSATYGYDRKLGGFYESGLFYRTADKRRKIWWVQAEALLAALQMYFSTHEQLYYEHFAQTLDWIFDHQVDWQHGEWHAVVSERLSPLGDKASAWKAPYHNGRAVLVCLDLLDRLREEPKAKGGAVVI